MLRFAPCILLLAVVSILFVACGGSGDSGDGLGKKAAVPVLTIGHVGHDHQIALGVAALQAEAMQDVCGVHLEEMKSRAVYRLMEGDKPLAELHVKKVGGGSRMPEAMSEGKIDIGLGGIPAVVFFVDKGNDFKILSPLNVDGDMLLVRPDFAAATWPEFVAAVKSSPEAVKIGYKAPVAVAKLIFVRACREAGLECMPAGKGKAGAVELVNLQGAGNTVPSLLSGAIHGAVINEPVGSIAVHKLAGRIVSLLADLPPAGQWKSHPCCCVCATARAIRDHRAVIVGLMKLIKAATARINADKSAAATLAHEWTKKPLAVEQMSVPNIVYTVSAGEAYRTGMFRWFDMMRELDKFQGSLKGLENEEAFGRTHDLSVLEQID